MAVILSFGVIMQDLLHGHLLAIVQRDKPALRALAEVAEGWPYPGYVVHSYGHLPPVPAQAPVQILLQPHQGLDGLIGELETPHHCTADQRAHRFY